MKIQAKMNAGVVKYPPAMYEEAKNIILSAIFSYLTDYFNHIKDPAIKNKCLDFITKQVRFYGVKLNPALLKNIVSVTGETEYYPFKISPDLSGLPTSYFHYLHDNTKDLSVLLDLSWITNSAKPILPRHSGQFDPHNNEIILSPKTITRLNNLKDSGDTYCHFADKKAKCDDLEMYKKYESDLKNYERNVFIVVHTEIETLLEVLQHELRHYVQYTILFDSQSSMKKDYSDNPISYYTSNVEFGPAINTAIFFFKKELLMQLTLLRNNDKAEFKKITEHNLNQIIDLYLCKINSVDESTQKEMSVLVQRITHRYIYGSDSFEVMKKGKPSAYRKAVNLFMRTAYVDIISAFKSLKKGKTLV